MLLFPKKTPHQLELHKYCTWEMHRFWLPLSTHYLRSLPNPSLPRSPLAHTNNLRETIMLGLGDSELARMSCCFYASPKLEIQGDRWLLVPFPSGEDLSEGSVPSALLTCPRRLLRVKKLGKGEQKHLRIRNMSRQLFLATKFGPMRKAKFFFGKCKNRKEVRALLNISPVGQCRQTSPMC